MAAEGNSVLIFYLFRSTYFQATFVKKQNNDRIFRHGASGLQFRKGIAQKW
jgi:hypothetical protein